MKFTIDDPLTAEQLAVIDEQRRTVLHERMRAVSQEGKVVSYLGREYLVWPTVFWPHADSQPLVKNYVINEGDVVCDYGTGSGVIAIESALRGAGRVIAFDINPMAVKNTRINAASHGVHDMVHAYETTSATWSHTLGTATNTFDVITANLPFSNHPARDDIERSTYDEGFKAHYALFALAPRVLKPKGRIYLSQANFGDPEKMISLAESEGFNVELIGRARDTDMPEKVYYAFEARRKE